MHRQWGMGSVRRPNEVLPGEQACSLSPIVAARYSGNNAPTRCICSIRFAVSARCLPSRVFLPPRYIRFQVDHCHSVVAPCLTQSSPLAWEKEGPKCFRIRVSASVINARLLIYNFVIRNHESQWRNGTSLKRALLLS